MQAENLIGRELGGIIVQERIGQDGPARIYRGFNPSTKENVAVKVLRIPKQNELLRQRFTEATAHIARLKHIHLLPIHEYGITADYGYTITDLVRGSTLADLLQRNPIPSFNETAHILSQVARGLSYAHASGIVHLDLNPWNITLDDSGNAFLMDLGLTRKVVGDDLMTSREGLTPKIAYMSPELLQGDAIDLRTDIYSMGVILYEMTTGRPPFNMRGDAMSILNRHIHGTPSIPQEINPEIPDSLQVVIQGAMAKDREDRYATIDDLLASLDDAASNLYEGIDIHDRQDIRLEPISIGEQTEHQEATWTTLPPILRNFIMLGTALFIIAAIAYLSFTGSQTTGRIVPGESGQAIDIRPNVDTLRRAQVVLERGSGQIAYIACDEADEAEAERIRDLQALAARNGLPLNVYDSGSDFDRQQINIDAVIQNNSRAVIACLLEDDATPLAAITDNSIYLVLDRPIADTNAVQVYAPEAEIGYAAGVAAAQDLGPGDALVVILGGMDADTLAERTNGLEAGFLASRPDMTLVGKEAGVTANTAEQSLTNLIEGGTEFNVVLTSTDGGAIGTIRALEAADIAPNEVAVYTVAPGELARAYIRDNYYLRGGLPLDNWHEATALYDTAINLLGGADIPQTVIPDPPAFITIQGGADVN